MPSSLEQLKNYLSKAAEVRGFKARLRERTGFSPSQLEGYVKGTTVPSLDVLDRIADAVGISPWELLKPKNDVKPAPPPPADPRSASALMELIQLLPQLDEVGREMLVKLARSRIEHLKAKVGSRIDEAK